MQMKYTFIHEWGTEIDADHRRIEHTFNAETYDEILEQFQQFLQGAGFCYIQPGTIVYDPELAD
jgi:hypothetical protein